MTESKSQIKPHVLLALAVFFLAFFIYRSILVQLLPGLPDIPGGLSVSTLVLMLFSLFHGWYTLGGQHLAVFFILSAVISWVYEQVGVATSLIFGAYHYTEVLGPKLGHVPFLIPIAWFMMIYPSYILANLVATGRPEGRQSRVLQIVWISFLSAMIMTAWDLVVDPVLSGPLVKAWIWENGGPYFGIPARNFAGWMLTTFSVYLIYRMYEYASPPRPAGRLAPGIIALPLVAYGAMMVANLTPGEPVALRVIAPFVMGLPLVVAAGRLGEYRISLGKRQIQS